MTSIPPPSEQHSYLRRLPGEYYHGQAYVHWTMTIEDRKTGWLTPVFHATVREILTHTMFRYALCCPLYCCMPDHIHLLWIGILDVSDQRNAAKYFRRHVNDALGKQGMRLQRQGHDHVLRQEERGRNAFENAVEYIARNPERTRLVGADRFHEYPYTGCVVPGYPNLTLWRVDFWDRFWRVYGCLQERGVFRSCS